MADTYYMVNITQCEFKKFVRKDRSRIGKPKQRVICKHCPQSHSPSMKNSLVTEAAQTSMPVNDMDLLTNDDIPEYGEKGEHRRHGRLAIYNEEWYMVDLEAIGKVSNPGASFVGMSDDDDFVSTINEFLPPNEYVLVIRGYVSLRLTIDRYDFPLRL